MIFTEKEAFEKRCTPAMVILTLTPDRLNETQAAHPGVASARCIGSRCAQWRWSDDNTRERRDGPIGLREAKPVAEWTGYCGLAGKP